MDTSKLQLGSVISQKDKPIAFWSRKCNPTSVERELFKIIETLKECRNDEEEYQNWKRGEEDGQGGLIRPKS